MGDRERMERSANCLVFQRIEVDWVDPKDVPSVEQRQKINEAIRAKAHESFLRVHVPRNMSSRYMDIDRLPDIAAFEAALKELTDEEYDNEQFGLYLFGPTGTSKTRCAIQSAERRIQNGDEIFWWTAYDLKQKLFELRNDTEKKAEFVNWLSDSDCPLYIDDFGHLVSESFLEVIRVILENRSCGSVVITTQYSLEEFVMRCNEKGMGRLGEAIARRLYEGCRRVQFVRDRRVAITESEKSLSGLAEHVEETRDSSMPGEDNEEV